MKTQKKGGVFCCLLANSAMAAPVTAKYEATSAVGSGANHSLWISTGLGGGVGSDFDFDPFGIMTFFDDGTATLAGDLVSQSNSAAGFNLAFN
jgi:hypothetical protein